MTGAELVDALGKRVEDEGDVNFPVAHKLQALNTAQKTLVNLLHNYYLTPLKSRASAKSLSVDATSGYAVQNFTTLFTSYFITGVTGTSPTNGNPTVFTKVGHTLANGNTVELSGFSEMTDVNGLTGIVEEVAGNNFQVKGVLGSPAETTGGTVTKVGDGSGFPIREGITRLYDNTNKRFAKIIPEMEFMPSATYSYGTVFCVEGNQIAVAPASCVSVDVYYLKNPTDLADTSAECEFSESLEPILLDLAESEIFFADNRQNRGNLAYQRAFQQIQILNQRLAEIE